MTEPVTISRLETIQEFKQCEVLQQTIWGADPIEATPADLLITIHRHGGLVLGAFDTSQRMIGFLFGFPGTTGVDNPSAGAPGQMQHCSHALGVVSEWQGKGIGYRLKLSQREWLLRQGIELVTWTYDPLESGNALLNFGKLGAVCRCYLRDLYGSMPDALNAGMPSDRFEVAWWINTARVRARVQTGWVRLSLGDLVQRGVPIVNPSILRSDGILDPGLFAIPTSNLALVELPWSIQNIKREVGDLAMSWRLSLREVMESLFAAGYEIDDVAEISGGPVRRCFYLLERRG